MTLTLSFEGTKVEASELPWLLDREIADRLPVDPKLYEGARECLTDDSDSFII